MEHKFAPKADKKNTVCLDKARFQILTDRIIRMEWAEDGIFEDRATLAVINRKTPPVEFSSKVVNNLLIIKTEYITLEYRNDGKCFSKNNPSISYSLNGLKTWTLDKKDAGNLKGTTRTLDEVAGDKCKLGDGFISRTGCALYDDSENPVIDEKDGQRWVAPRGDSRRQDFYVFVYGHDYKAALRGASKIFGRQPLPPRYTLGYWWSRYWAYTDKEFEKLAGEFETMNLPLDVMVVDMDWHLDGWTGYTWDKRYFPNHLEFLSWLKKQGLKITLNLHPADGVAKFEDQFKDMAKTLGLDPKEIDKIDFDCTDPEYMSAYFKILHHPMEKAGVDFWWMDWQQGSQTKIKNLDPLPWLNQLHWQDMEKRNKSKRPLIFSRFGGPGAGRYPIGFSGDTHSIWPSLEFQPYFTATASNVLYGYWSHDIGGHNTGHIAPELYARWIQYSIFSPIVRTHTTKNAEAERRVWKYPDPYSDVMMKALRMRYELVPYIYTENRECYDSGVSLCRPMYYEYPELDIAYAAKNQYMFGHDMLAAPVTKPVSAKDEMAEMDIWLPNGRWFDTAHGVIEGGNGKIKRKYNIHEIPIFVREGTVIPGQQFVTRLEEGPYHDLVITAYPGSHGHYTLYEDDGVSRDYAKGRYAKVDLLHETSKGVRRVYVYKAHGGYKGFEKDRSLEIRFPSATPPQAVRVDKKPLKWAYRLSKRGWTYDGDTATVIVRIPSFDITKGLMVELTMDKSIPDDMAMGLKGVMSRLDRIRELVILAMDYKPIHPNERLAVEAAQTGNRISRDPEKFKEEVRRLALILQELPGVLSEMKKRQKHVEKKKYLQKAANILAVAVKLFETKTT